MNDPAERLTFLTNDIYHILLKIVVNEVFIRAKNQRAIERSRYINSEVAAILKDLPNSGELTKLIIEKYNIWDMTLLNEITISDKDSLEG